MFPSRCYLIISNPGLSVKEGLEEDGLPLCGREAAADLLIQLGHGDVPAPLAQLVEDDLALGRQAVTPSMGGGEDEGRVGHWVGHCKCVVVTN